MPKQPTEKKNTSRLIFVNPEKKKRAEDIYLILTGKNPKESVSSDTKAHLQERFAELMSEADVDLKNKDEAILFIYKKLAGALRTPEQQAKIKKLGNIFKGKAVKEAREEDDNDTEVDDDDEDEDEDEE